MVFLRQSSKSLLSLMQLTSVNFPLGIFSYSRGLEWAIESNWIHSMETFILWQKQWIYGQLIYLEWPMLRSCYSYTKINDAMNFFQCTLRILAHRDTYEFRLEEKQRGESMVKLILQWYAFVDKYWLLGLKNSGLAAMAWLGCMWGIPLESLLLGYAYSTLESSVMVGLKLVPFGQTKAQKLLRYLIDILLDAWNQFNLSNNTVSVLGSSFPLQSIASACHETQYSRLFRS